MNNIVQQQLVQSKTNQAHQSPQVITIVDTKSTVLVSLPNLQSYYSNIQGSQVPISYSLTYFDFPSEQITVKAGDTVYINFDTLLTSTSASAANSIDQGTTSVNQDYNRTPGLTVFTASRDYIMNAAELAEAIDGTLKDIFFQNQLQIDAGSTADMIGVIDLLARNYVEFLYDSTAQKYAVQFTGKALQSQNFATLQYRTQFLFAVKMALRIVPQTTDPQNDDRYLRLQRLLGAKDFVMTYNDLSQHTVGQTEMIAGYHGSYSLFQSVFRRNNPLLFPAYQNTMSASSKYFLGYSYDVPRLHLSDFVYIHTSLFTGSWDHKTSKTSIMAVIPRNRGYGETPYYTECSSYGEIQVNETLSSAKSFQLRLTDKDGHLLDEFSKPYTLQITLKFL